MATVVGFAKLICDNETSPQGATNTTGGSDHLGHLMEAGTTMAEADSTQCAVTGCATPKDVRGWCTKHYNRWLTHGDPMYVRVIPDYPTRFEAFVDRSGECHRWTGSHNNRGYGWFRYERKLRLAHVVALILDGQTIPDGMTVDHVRERGCQYRDCVRLDHLEIVTMRENILRSDGFSAINARKTHCPQGHPYAGDNLHISKRGYRVCRSCQREQEQRRPKRLHR